MIGLHLVHHIFQDSYDSTKTVMAVQFYNDWLQVCRNSFQNLNVVATVEKGPGLHAGQQHSYLQSVRFCT